MGRLWRGVQARRSRFALMAGFAAIALLSAPSISAAPATPLAVTPHYAMTVLDPLDGGNLSNAAGISNRGWIVGDSTLVSRVADS
jgi:hypothetical protein